MKKTLKLMAALFIGVMFMGCMSAGRRARYGVSPDR